MNIFCYSIISIYLFLFQTHSHCQTIEAKDVENLRKSFSPRDLAEFWTALFTLFAVLQNVDICVRYFHVLKIVPKS